MRDYYYSSWHGGRREPDCPDCQHESVRHSPLLGCMTIGCLCRNLESGIVPASILFPLLTVQLEEE